MIGVIYNMAKKTGLYIYAKSELDRVYTKESLKCEMNKYMYNNILRMVDSFSGQGHSGFSAHYCLDIFDKIIRYKPLTELTNSEYDWNDVSEYCSEEAIWQSSRNPSCFSLDLQNYYDIDSKRLNKVQRIFTKHYNGWKLIELKEELTE
jgi:hypothetical protein